MVKNLLAFKHTIVDQYLRIASAFRSQLCKSSLHGLSWKNKLLPALKLSGQFRAWVGRDQGFMPWRETEVFSSNYCFIFWSLQLSEFPESLNTASLISGASLRTRSRHFVSSFICWCEAPNVPSSTCHITDTEKSSVNNLSSA